MLILTGITLIIQKLRKVLGFALMLRKVCYMAAYGGVTVSVETREGLVSFQGSGSPTWGPDKEGYAHACEIGVFCNGILIARSGKIHCGAFTLDIPFGLPIGNEFCEIVVKWIHEQHTARDEASGTWDTADIDHFYRFVCAGISTWCRNQYR
jgi:hypothetical protein